MLDLHHDILPDTVVSALKDIMTRLDRWEEKSGLYESGHVSIDEESCWKNIDMSGRQVNPASTGKGQVSLQHAEDAG